MGLRKRRTSSSSCLVSYSNRVVLRWSDPGQTALNPAKTDTEFSTRNHTTVVSHRDPGITRAESPVGIVVGVC